MFKRRKKEDDRTELDAAWEEDQPSRKVTWDEERTELDAAWDDEKPTPYFDGAAADSSEEADAGEEIETFVEVTEATETDEVTEATEATEADEVTEAAVATVATEATEVAIASEVTEAAEAYEAEELDVISPEDIPASTPGALGRHDSGLTSKQAALESMPEHQKQSRRMRRILVLVAILLLALLAALGYYSWRLHQESMVVAEQESTGVTTEVEVAAETEEVAADTGSVSAKKTNVPYLMGLLGKTQDEALEALGSGAAITLETEIDDETSPMSHRTTVVLTEEPTDTKSGAPTVYLGLDNQKKVVIAGYSAATASLGYGTLSFADVVGSQYVVERTMTEAGLALEEGTVVLPEASSYSTYAEDGKTLIKEQCSFDGEAQQDGVDYLWTSVLVYNYTAANATGNLSDTVRQVYVYVSDKAASEAAIKAKKEAKEAAEAKKKAEEEKKKAEEEAKKAEGEAAEAE